MVTIVGFIVYNTSDELFYDNLFNEHLYISYTWLSYPFFNSFTAKGQLYRLQTVSLYYKQKHPLKIKRRKYWKPNTIFAKKKYNENIFLITAS